MNALDDLHFSESQHELDNIWEIVLQSWQEKQDPDMCRFISYFENTWMNSKHNKWQIFHTPAGYPKTNNPVEITHSQFKRVTYYKLFYCYTDIFLEIFK